jgi:hypothetical protein
MNVKKLLAVSLWMMASLRPGFAEDGVSYAPADDMGHQFAEALQGMVAEPATAEMETVAVADPAAVTSPVDLGKIVARSKPILVRIDLPTLDFDFGLSVELPAGFTIDGKTWFFAQGALYQVTIKGKDYGKGNVGIADKTVRIPGNLERGDEVLVEVYWNGKWVPYTLKWPENGITVDSTRNFRNNRD